MIVGCEEWCSIPDLRIDAIKVKIDSGAATSSIHAYNIHTRVSDDDGREYAYFDVSPLQGDESFNISCQAPIVARRVIKSSNGISEKRIIISASITMGGVTWPIEISLANRSTMGYRMLLGKEAMSNIFVDMSKEYALGSLSSKQLREIYNIDRPKKGKKRILNVILLASNPELYSNKRIMESFKQRGHSISFMNVNQCYIKIVANAPSVFYRGKKVEGVDVVVPRLRPSVTFFGCAVLRQFAALGAYCLNGDEAITSSRNKLRCLQILAQKGLSVPISAFANSPLDTEYLIDIVEGTPLILKLLEGTQGKGVVLIDTPKAAKSVIEAFKSIKASVLVQRFVKEANGEDIRCFVIGGKVVAAMKRQADSGEFRSNLHLGGKATLVKLDKDEVSMAKLAAKTLGLQVAGVDIVRSRHGSQIIEVNSSPGLEGIEGITGLDIAGKMVDFLEKNVFLINKDKEK